MAIDEEYGIPNWIEGLLSKEQRDRIQNHLAPDRARGGLEFKWPEKIHLRYGAGHEPRPSTLDILWINVDWEAKWDFGPSIVSIERDIVGLEGIPTEQIDHIEADEVFEHIHPDRIKDVLFEANRVLKMDHELRIVVPDFDEMVRLYLEECKGNLNDTATFNQFKAITYQLLNPLPPESKSQYGAGTWHQSLWTPEFAQINLESEGFELVSHRCEDWHLYLEAKKNHRL